VRPKVVIKRDRNRKTAAAPSFPDGFEQARRGNDGVMRPDVPQVFGQDVYVDGRYELEPRAGPGGHAVVHEHEADTSPGEAHDGGNERSDQASKEPIDGR
jgi:hypothetical protein